MKREILFRGKRADNKEWVYGIPVVGILGAFILPQEYCFPSETLNTDLEEVFEASIGQYAGIKDKNGKKVFEGDILSCDNFKMYGSKYPVRYDEELTMFVTKLANIQETALYKHRGIEVIGNIYDNPKLLTA